MSEETRSQPLFGLVLVVMAMSIIGLIDNFVVHIAAEVGLWQFHAIRSLALCGIIWVLAWGFGWRLRPVSWRAVAARSFFFSTAMVLYFGSLGAMSVAQAGAGLFSSPIFVLLISALILGAGIGIWRILAVAIGFAGVLLILKPWSDSVSVMAVLPVLAGIFYALNGIATRRWCEAESTGTLLMGLFGGLGVWGVLGTIWFTLNPFSVEVAGDFAFFTRGWVPISGPIWGWIAVQIVGSLMAVAMLTRGYQVTEVSFVTVFEYSFLIFAGFWGIVLFGVVPDGPALLGIVLIITSGTIIALRSR